MPTPANPLSIRGYLLHITHYDPNWLKHKDTEKPFDLDVAREVVDTMAEVGMNLLVVDCKDGVRYASHPELARHYTHPIETLTTLAQHARKNGIEVALKLNFSQSTIHQHNHWFRPHNGLFDRPEYWERAFRIIDELIAAAQPERFFHIGMDEDHWRSYSQYVTAITTLHAGLAKRNLRTMVWNDSACAWPEADIHREKSIYAETRIPQDTIQILWDYSGVDAAAFARIRNAGFDLWAAPGMDPELAERARQELNACGGMGMLLTRWRPCIKENRNDLLTHIRTAGPICSRTDS